MHERRFQGDIDRLRTPERVALLEVDRVVDLCLEDVEVDTVLDVGTGSGIFAEAFSGRGKRVTGIDPNPAMLEAAGTFVPSGEFLHGTIEAIPLSEASFDVVFLGHVLHESDDLARALAETRRVAKKRVCVLEWPHKAEESGPPLEHRLTTDQVVLAAKGSGFSRIETIGMQHMVFFRLTV
jgi:ubiquinone/menaquinone biosynthesis C-methylase UbiE